MRVPAEHVYATHYIRLSLEHLQDLSIGKSALFEDPSKRIQVNSSGTFDLSVVRRVRQAKVLLGVGMPVTASICTHIAFKPFFDQLVSLFVGISAQRCLWH